MHGHGSPGGRARLRFWGRAGNQMMPAAAEPREALQGWGRRSRHTGHSAADLRTQLRSHLGPGQTPEDGICRVQDLSPSNLGCLPRVPPDHKTQCQCH